MCGRFFFEGDWEDVIRRFSIESVEARDRGYGEIFPSNEFPIVYNRQHNVLANYRWGFSAPYLKTIVINARLETLDSKPMFKGAFKERRCIIPASYYFEWKPEGSKKVKHKIYREDTNILYMAGLFGSFIDKKGENYQGFTIITTEAATAIEGIHDRMPLILEGEQLKLWLDSSFKEAEVLKEAFSQGEEHEGLLAVPV